MTTLTSAGVSYSTTPELGRRPFRYQHLTISVQDGVVINTQGRVVYCRNRADALELVNHWNGVTIERSGLIHKYYLLC